MTDVTPQLTYLHGVYCQLSKRSMTMTTREMYGWQAWIAKGYKVEDLRLVIAFIQKRIKDGRRFPESLRFHNLIERHDRFADDLLDSRAEANKPVRTDRQSVLEASGRPDPCPDKVQSAEQVIRGSEALRKLLELRDSL